MPRSLEVRTFTLAGEGVSASIGYSVGGDAQDWKRRTFTCLGYVGLRVPTVTVIPYRLCT
jgi:hypothetical protein